jgi:hypothetical protein
MTKLPPKDVEKELLEALKFTAKIAKKIRKEFEEFEERRRKIRRELDNGARKTKGFSL